MAQINLLKQKTPMQNFWQFLPGLIAKIMVVLALVLVGFYIWQFSKLGKIKNQIVTTQQAIDQAEQSVNAITNRNEIYTRQAQLQQLNGLIGKHLYWSQLFPALASVTLKQASFSSISATKDGNIILSVDVPDLISMDKFTQVFDLPEFNANFNNLRIGSFSKIVKNGQQMYGFDVRMNFNPILLSAATASTQASQ